jgi:hypothetical protein
MKEQARQEMAEEDLGGGMFDQDVKEMRKAAGSCNEPQIYTPTEQEILDKQLAIFNKPPPKRLKKYKTRTRLLEAQVGKEGTSMNARVQMTLRAPVEQVVAWTNARAPQFNQFTQSGKGNEIAVGERSSDHSVIVRQRVQLPIPFDDREVVGVSLWRKLGENAYFVAQTQCEHVDFPLQRGQVRMSFGRCYKLTRLSAKLTRLEMVASGDLGGRFPSSIGKALAAEYVRVRAKRALRDAAAPAPAHSESK